MGTSLPALIWPSRSSAPMPGDVHHAVAASLTGSAIKPQVAHTASQVLVYCGEGAGARSVASAVQALRKELQPHITVGTLSSKDLLTGRWQRGCACLVMPGTSGVVRTLIRALQMCTCSQLSKLEYGTGGADLPYCNILNGVGNKLIKGVQLQPAH